jgi:Tol biopolymer transport system component
MPRLLAAVALAALVLAGCGGSSAKGPPAMVFVSIKDGDYAIFGANADGGNARRLTEEKGDPATPAGLFFQLQPAWSANGTKIAFSSLRDGTSHIYVMNADGSGTRRLTNTFQRDDHPSWSADGKRIVFSRGGALFVVPAAGGKAHRIGRGLGSAQDPAVSPDGRLIAYSYRKPGSRAREIYVMSSDGTNARAVTGLGATSALPAWSPDGRRLAFQSNANLDHYEIYTVALDGTHLEPVTTSFTDVIQPAFTPEGAIGFSRDGAIWVRDGKDEKQLTSGDDIDTNPVWRSRQPA